MNRMNSESSVFFSNPKAVAVLDIGITTQKIVVLEPNTPNFPLSYQRMFFPLEKNKKEFENFIKSLLRSYSDFGIRTFILTTTAAPLFNSDKETVEFIAKVVSKYVYNVLFYSSENKFFSIDEAIKNPEKIVSANWRAVGNFINHIYEEDCLIVEFTTRSMSLIPIKNKTIISRSKNDHERIKNFELFFYGLLETNAAYIENPLTIDGEIFHLPFKKHASTGDIFILTNDLQPSQHPDQSLNTEEIKNDALMNVAKMFSISESTVNKKVLVNFATIIRDIFIKKLLALIKEKLNTESLKSLILTGSGAEVLYYYVSRDEQLKDKKIVQGTNLVNTELSPAYAIARLYSLKDED